MASSAVGVIPSSAVASADTCSDAAMEHILQEIVAVGHRHGRHGLKDHRPLHTASNSIQSDIASFQDKVTDMDHRLTDVEGQLATVPKRDSE
ncbi:hypothetical protein NDU88_008979 [Pleurodeles waltl]|uniref:Uncharacterized protein n=1 Tax=Pleurodeles waltl TaxID=8319 RepID=A0AAV7PQX9_PLEWA|nr:hypothetical protein NDU88_008979 [Pleurodeles waltl]